MNPQLLQSSMAYFKKEGSFERRSQRNDKSSRSRPNDSDRFDTRNSRSRPNDFDRFDDRSSRRAPLELFDAVCDKCGADCQLPFKPKGNKPVYCRDCFEKNDNKFESRSKSKVDNSSEQFDEIHKKLDKIMKSLKLD